MTMKHIHDAIRAHLLSGIALNQYEPRSAAEAEMIEAFYALARNRMSMGCFRYGRLQDKALRGYVINIQDRLNEYLRTHNTELLVDVANLAMIEFLYPTFRDAKFEPIDDGVHCRVA